MNSKPRALLVGLRVDAVDFDKWPQLSPEKLEAAFEETRERLAAAGVEPGFCLVDSGETAEQEFREKLATFEPDVVVIGAGVRADADHLLLFERLVNIFHAEAPDAKLAFNTLPKDTVEAVQRWA